MSDPCLLVLKSNIKEAVPAKNTFKFYFLNMKNIPLTIALYKITTT